MNNILLDSTISYDKEGIYKLTLNNDSFININNSNIKLYLVTENDIKITINIKGKVEIYNFTKNNITVDLNLLENANLEFYQMTITNNNIVNELNAYHKHKDTISNLVCNGISYDKGNLKFIVNGYVKKGMINSICNQTSRIVNLGNAKSLIEPNLFIEEFDSLANHSAYTGPFDKRLLFYLETKGISRNNAYKLLLKGLFKVKELPKDYEEVIDESLFEILRR